ncbi:hypothetical protein AVEN_37555-1 [Araneus ventricosus]|uniref:Uncharacterized protein n=1 Tax=Araneus ventricosus TaxID=182803 RepID=A0A4Y2QWJ5_ARAVE|nr:hypothetical protein AVEN_37555-1 [Araneus ventricosus]
MRCSRRVNMPSYEKTYRERSPSRRSVRKSRDFTRSTDCNPNAPSLYIPPLWKKSPFQERVPLIQFIAYQTHARLQTGRMPQPHPDEFQPLWSEISATYVRGAARKCFRAKGRNTDWGCR